MTQAQPVQPQEPTPAQKIAAAAKALDTKQYKTFQNIVQQAGPKLRQSPRMLHLRGLYAFEKKQGLRAVKLISEAIKKRPKELIFKHNLAVILSSLGEFEKAKDLLLEVIKANPNYAEAYHTLSPIYKFTKNDTLISGMEAALQKEGLTGIERSFLDFAMAKAKDDIGDTESAWGALVSGNSKTKTNYDSAKETRGVTELDAYFTREKIEALRVWGHQTQAPIFVVGMPRSGTTLLEAIIAEHPQVHGAGELVAMGNIARDTAEELGSTDHLPGRAQLLEIVTPEALYKGGVRYMTTTRQSSKVWFDRVVDKMPDNSFNIGIIHAMLPRADIIHIMRHPLDTMLSMYFQRFKSVNYAFNPEAIVTHYKNYTKAMDIWRDRLPHPIIELRYENLVKDRDHAQRKLWEALQLTSLVAHANSAPQAELQDTASRWQVRQPVYQTSREKFRKYETHMAPFIEAMGGMAAIEAEVAAQKARCWLNANS